MQGRLSPPPTGRTQSFHLTSWEAEFPRAKQCGFDAIEWLFEADRFERNPVWMDAGRDALLAASTQSGVRVRSLCADYFMAHPFFRVSTDEQTRSVEILEKLIERAAAAEISTILIPVLEVAELRTRSDEVELLRCLERPLDRAAARGIRIGLETELPAADYRRLVEGAGHAALAVYYDAGNAAAKGFDAAEDIATLGHLLCGVHLKDRTVGGPSVPLGQGAVEFDAVFSALAVARYAGPLVIQSTSGNDYLERARAHLAFVNERLDARSRIV